MVASIAKMAQGAERYYARLAKEDYYLNGGEPPGRWIGEAASPLGLTGTVNSKELSNVIAGFGSDGTALVKNAGAKNRQVGWDMTFSAPKSVSVIWGIADDDLRKKIEHLHNQAVDTAIDYLQKNCVWSRTGPGGREWKRAEAVVAAFNHGTSRDADLQLHTHALFTNVGVREDGKTGTIVSKKLFENKMLSGAIYRSALAESLKNSLGLEIEVSVHQHHLLLVGEA